jgi:hypothetical protein
MPADQNDLEARVNILEQEMARVRHDAASARVLAGSADRDVAEFHVKLSAHNKTLNVLRETQLEQGQQLAEMRAEMRAEIQNVRAEMQAGFSTLNVGMAQITALLKGMTDSEPTAS